MLGILLRSCLYVWVKEWRERYPGTLSLGGEVVSLGLSLGVYWYTARAFAGHADFAGQGQDYFTYIVLGEASLMMPLGLLAGLTRTAREAQNEGVLEALLTLPWSGVRTLLLLGAPGVLRDGIRACALLGVAWLLGMSADASRVAGWLLLQSAALPVFVGISVAATAFSLRTGRGEGMIAFASSLGAIAAGTYFPVTLFPEKMAGFLSVASPINIVLEGARGAFASDGGLIQWSALERLLGWGVLAVPLSVATLAWSLRAIRRRGSVEVTT